MKITIRRFGPLSEFVYDLSKDIIVTYGDNNIGKSYAMQVVYLLLKNFNEYLMHGANYFDAYYYYGYSRHHIAPNGVEEIHSTVSKFADGKQSSLDITKAINSFILLDFKERLVVSFLNSCKNTFGNYKGIISQKPQIVVEFNVLSLTFNLGDNKQPIQSNIYTYPTVLKRSTSDFHKSRNANGHLDIYYFNNVETTVSTIIDVINDRLRDLSIELAKYLGNVYFLPASRSGIYSGMSAFSSIIAELSKNKAMLTKKIELPGISEPISDYFLMLSNMKVHENEKLSGVYKNIENDILKGTVSFNKNSNTLVYTPTGVKHEFEMTEVSSMVSEISPVVAFLKYIITSSPSHRGHHTQPIVFIEEPEAHLHPKNQIKLITLFSSLHKLGLKLVISSHSNYIFNKLNNLLLEKVITPQIYSPILLRSTEEGSISTFMSIDELGVDDTNFFDVTAQLYEERETLIDNWSE